MIEVTPHIVLQESEVLLSFVRASGPGGQNVNKVATACELRFDVKGSLSLPADVALRLMKLGGRKITKDGVLVLSADRYRSQEQNRQDAIQRLIDLVREAAKPPPPKRRPTKPTKASVERRLKSKTARASVKKSRTARSDND